MVERTAVRISGSERGSRAAPVEVDPYEPRTYMRFVATAAVDLLSHHVGHTTRGAIAKELGMQASNLSVQLARQDGPTPEFLSRLERQYLCRQHPLHHGAPWLTSFYEELHQSSEPQDGGSEPKATAQSRLQDSVGAGRHEAVRIPIGWFYNLAKHRARNSTEAFVQGHALRAFLYDARQATSDTGVDITVLLEARRLTDKAKNTVATLLDVVAGPPRTGQPAVRLVASFGELALSQVEAFIYSHPAGFRAGRILGRILSRRAGADQDLMSLVEATVRRIEDDDEFDDPYPARSLIVEALRFIEWPWATDALLRRTRREDRPIRERVYAAYLLFRRGEHELAAQVMNEFKPSTEEGLNYAAAFLETLFKREVEGARTPYPWPHWRPESSIVDGATKLLEDDESVPYSVRGALRDMVQGALLTIDGTARRNICEAIQAAGLGESAVEGLSSVIRDEASPPWLVEHAAFIVGYLQTGYSLGAGRAVATLAPLAKDQDRQGAVRHAALWGIGDIAGSIESIEGLGKEWQESGQGFPDGQAPVKPEQFLVRLVAECSQAGEDAGPPEVRRAAAYTAAMLARRCTLGRTKRRHTVVWELLDRLAKDEDQLVRGFGEWGKRIESGRIENRGYLAPTEPEATE